MLRLFLLSDLGNRSQFVFLLVSDFLLNDLDLFIELKKLVDLLSF